MHHNPHWATGAIKGRFGVRVVSPNGVAVGEIPGELPAGLRLETTPRDPTTGAPLRTVDGLTGLAMVNGRVAGMYLHQLLYLTWAWDRCQPGPLGPEKFTSRKPKSAAAMRAVASHYFPDAALRLPMLEAWLSPDGWRKGVHLASVPRHGRGGALDDVATAVARVGDPEVEPRSAELAPFTQYVHEPRQRPNPIDPAGLPAVVWALTATIRVALENRHPGLWAVVESALRIDAFAALGHLVAMRLPAGGDAAAARAVGMAIAASGSVLAGPNPTPGVGGVSNKIRFGALTKAGMGAELVNAIAAVVGLRADPAELWGVLAAAAATVQQHLSPQPHAVMRWLGNGAARRMHVDGVVAGPKRNRTHAVYPPGPGRPLGPVVHMLASDGAHLFTTPAAVAGAALLVGGDLEVTIELGGGGAPLAELRPGPVGSAVRLAATVAAPVPFGALAWLHRWGARRLTIGVPVAEIGAVGGLAWHAIRRPLPNIAVDRSELVAGQVVGLHGRVSAAEYAALKGPVGLMTAGSGALRRVVVEAFEAAAEALGHRRPDPAPPLDALLAAGRAALAPPSTKRRRLGSE